MLRRTFAQLPRTVNVLCSRAGSTSSDPPLPPPSPIKTIGHYVAPRWVLEEHMAPIYRDAHEEDDWSNNVVLAIATTMWTWILLGFWYESEHVFGHYEWPDAKKWTDKELGIPSDLEIE